MIPGDGSVGGAWALLGAVGWGRAADCWACLPRQPPALPRVWESSVPGRQVCVGQGAKVLEAPCPGGGGEGAC